MERKDAKVALAEVMGGTPARGLPSFQRGLPSFLRAALVIPVRACHSCARALSFLRGLPSFPRRRESVWYGGECESVGYDVSVRMT